MKKRWTDILSAAVYDRLCACKTIKADLPELVAAKWISYMEAGKDDEGFTIEDAMVAIIDLLDSNSQYIDLTKEEWDALYKAVAQGIYPANW